MCRRYYVSAVEQNWYLIFKSYIVTLEQQEPTYRNYTLVIARLTIYQIKVCKVSSFASLDICSSLVR